MVTEIRAGLRKPFAVFINEAKHSLKNNNSVELHGIGESISIVIRASEILTSQGYANLVTFHTTTFSEEKDGTKRSKPKVITTLSKAPTFDKALQDFENSRKNS